MNPSDFDINDILCECNIITSKKSDRLVCAEIIPSRSCSKCHGTGLSKNYEQTKKSKDNVKERKCGNCEHWKKTGVNATGLCKNHSPNYNPIHETGPIPSGVWPTTKKNDCCGEFEEKKLERTRGCDLCPWQNERRHKL